MRSFLLALTIAFTAITANAVPAEAYYLYWYRGQVHAISESACYGFAQDVVARNNLQNVRKENLSVSATSLSGDAQVEWVDTNWLYYRGEHKHDGSLFFQRSRPPARPVKACRDVDSETDIFYTGSWDLPVVNPTDTLPLTLTVSHSDNPSAVVVNSKTGKDNFLREAQLEFLFCTILSARDPAGKYHHVKSFYWNLRWQAQFLRVTFANPNGGWHVTPVRNGQGQAV